MKKLTIISYSAFLLILIIFTIFFRSLYFNQVEHFKKLLDRQVIIVGSEVDNTSMYIVSDLVEFDFSEDVALFFSDQNVGDRAKEKIKLYYSKYEDLVISVMLYNNTGDVYTLFKDEEKNTWLDGSYKAQLQPEIFDHERLEAERDKYKYYLPIIDDGQVIANFVITVDLMKYFSRVFTKYNLEDYQWQWIVNDTGVVVFDNHIGTVGYSQLSKISDQVSQGISGRISHDMITGKVKKEVMSSFYPVNILGKDFGIIFSAPTDFFRKYIIRNSLFLGLGILSIVFFLIWYFRRIYLKESLQAKETGDSVSALMDIIDQMPVGVIVYNDNREIVNANKHAASLFSYVDEEEMVGKLVPELSGNEYSIDLNGPFGQGKIIRLGSSSGDRMVFLSSTQVNFKGENATLEVYIDVTALESARKQEAEANIAKSELLARMSYEIRTPLNGIIGMTEMLNRADLPQETTEVAMLLKRSADLLLNIINDIFDVSKVETGKMILDEIPFRLREELSYCSNLVKRENPESLVLILSEIDQSVPENLIGDPYRLRQIITNLLYFSLSSTQTGEIKLHCSVKETDGNVIDLAFTMIDTGKNYTKAEIKKIFGDYITGRTGRADWAEELKLGPILARQLVELMGGELVAVSPAMKDQAGHERGLKISFTIRTHLNERINKSIDLKRYKDISEIRTLAIAGGQARDDDFLGVIHRAGLPVSVTSYQKYTISQITSDKQNNTDRFILLIIFDEPDSDGFEVAKALRDADLTGEFIILMFTSKDPKGHYSRCVDLGVDHLLVKPFAAEDLVLILKNYFPSLRTGAKRTEVKDRNAMPSVLVVDDNHLNRKVVGSLLKVLGITAEFAESGKEAFEKYENKPFDLVFMDLIMPGIDGFEAAKMILDLNDRALIIALSADNMPDTKLKAEQTGMKEMLTKPVSVEDLRKVIDRYL